MSKLTDPETQPIEPDISCIHGHVAIDRPADVKCPPPLDSPVDDTHIRWGGH